jgi:hypothetical protein
VMAGVVAVGGVAVADMGRSFEEERIMLTNWGGLWVLREGDVSYPSGQGHG